MRYKRKGYNINGIKQSAYIVFNTIIVDDFAFLFNCMRWVGAQTQLWGFDIKLFISWSETELYCLFLGPTGLKY